MSRVIFSKFCVVKRICVVCLHTGRRRGGGVRGAAAAALVQVGAAAAAAATRAELCGGIGGVQRRFKLI
jgi:hypothetical protein